MNDIKIGTPRGPAICEDCGEAIAQGVFLVYVLVGAPNQRPILRCSDCRVAARKRDEGARRRIAEAMQPAAIKARLAKVPVTRARGKS